MLNLNVIVLRLVLLMVLGVVAVFDGNGGLADAGARGV